MKFLEARVLDYDKMEPFIIPYLPNDYALEVEDIWGNFAIGANLFKKWSKISLQQATRFQRNSYDHCVDDEDTVSCEWTLELFVNSCDGAFIRGRTDKTQN